MAEELSQSKDCILRTLHGQARAPRSTYRLQLHRGFTFADAQSVLPYLKQLGIGDCYTSPIFEARPGSMHGYDVTRHDRLNSELGGDEAFEIFSSTLHELGMGLLIDIVPNHMGIGNDSIWWQDVLQNGRSSQYAEYFDIDWTPLKEDMKDKLLLPILGSQYGEELESRHIQIAMENGQFRVDYYDHRMPVAPRSLPVIFPENEYDDLGVPQDFRDLLRELAHIPPHATTDTALTAQRREQLGELRPRLREMLLSDEMQPILARAIAKINGVEGDTRSFDRLHELLEQQPYRLAFWKVSAEEINYRRFFDINDLAGLRMENPEVFAATHCLIRRMMARGQATGFRIDHADGLFNPRQYLIRLQLLYVASQCGGQSPQGELSPNGIEKSIRESVRGYDWNTVRGPFYVVVEKILEPKESLPQGWPVLGTSGYDFVHFSNQIFIQSQNEKRFTDFYAKLTDGKSDPDDIIYRSKLNIMQNSLSSEVYVLTNLLSQLAATERRARDFTDNILEAAIRETIACFPVYRTYVDDRGKYTEHDRAVIERAVARARQKNPEVDATAFDFLKNTLLLHGRSGADIDPRELYFTLKFQQLTGPVMAKGVEDTSFYVYTRFVSSNEVGSSIKVFGISPERFHESNRARLDSFPDAMLATSTHDTKRSEDVRNRLNVLSELANLWPSWVRRWQRINAKYKRTLDDGRVAPGPAEEYLIYQTIVGAWPWSMNSTEDRKQFLGRLQEYMTKALSEAKVNLSWTSPNPQYVEAVHGFLRDILMPGNNRREPQFVQTLRGLMPTVEIFGAVNSLAQVVLKTASPGVPDFYQGSEMWDLSLVDPDNRRPVDYDLRRSALTEMQSMAEREGLLAVCRDTLRTLSDGRVKLWTAHRALSLRNRMPEVFQRGEYVPAVATNGHKNHVIAFARGRKVIAAVPRFACTLMNGKTQLPLQAAWGDAALLLPDFKHAVLENIFTDEQVQVSADGRLALRVVFAEFPAALFTVIS
ncbi:malto-oligosyltrehalose synthase [Paracidobacterium acidisoli]|nr:malto-oligosyltrehalose synthase [Paracidobacterium acidisoli]MBT9333155.1 malto-oligosyltrehalose synthase [Paracidobacterium acidisoli]